MHSVKKVYVRAVLVFKVTDTTAQVCVNESATFRLYFGNAKFKVSSKGNNKLIQRIIRVSLCVF